MWSVVRRVGRLVSRAGILATLIAIRHRGDVRRGRAVLDRAQQREMTQALDRKVGTVAAVVANETGRYVDTLRTVAASIGAFEPFTAEKFTRAVQPLRSMGLAGATSVAFAVPVGGDEIDRVQELWRQRGMPGLR